MIHSKKIVRYICYLIIIYCIIAIGNFFQRFSFLHCPENCGFHFSNKYVLLDKQYALGRELKYGDFILYKNQNKTQIGMIVTYESKTNLYLIQSSSVSLPAILSPKQQVVARIVMVLL
jgi:hypothetical protein